MTIALSRPWTWLSEPRFDDTELTRRAVLAMTVIRVVLVGIVVVVMASLVDPKNSALLTAILFGPVVVALFGSALMLHRGWVIAVGWFQALFFWFLVSAAIWMFGGLHSQNGAAYMVSILIGTTVLGGRVGLGLAIAASINAGVAAWVEQSGTPIYSMVEMTPINAWIGIAGPMVMATALAGQSAMLLRRTIRQERQAREALGVARAQAEHQALLASILGELVFAAARSSHADELLQVTRSLLKERISVHEVAVLRMTPQPVVWWPSNETVEPDPTLLRLVEHDGTEVVDPSTSTLPDAPPGYCWVVSCPPVSGAHRWAVALCLPQVSAETGFARALASLLVTCLERDATEQRALLSQKLEAVGRMAGGVAHDFNNLLTVIVGAADLLALQDPDNELVIGLMAAGQRASLLTRQLLTVSQGKLPEPAVLDLTRTVTEAVPLLRRMVSPGCGIEVVPSPSVLVMSSRVVVEQVLLNLCLNASQAMAATGTVRVQVVGDQDIAELRVSDEGPGVAPADRERIFEPFFTTRQGGTGLGLATVRDLARRFDGEVRVEEAPSGGACFVLTLPRHHAVVEPDMLPPSPEQQDGLLLLVEDQEAVRGSIRAMAMAGGWRVHAVDGAEAALAWLASGKRLAVVLSDVVMPGMDGLALERVLSAQHPDLPVVLMSGFHQVGEGQKVRAELLTKPFSRVALLQALERALDSRSVQPGA